MKPRIIIMADGDGKRWGDHLGVPKHFAEIDGKPIMQRTLELLYEKGVNDIIITSHNPMMHRLVEDFNAEHDLGNDCVGIHEPENNNNEIDKFGCTDGLWNEEGDTVLLYGDVYFTREAIDDIVNTMGTSEPHFFGRSMPSTITGKRYKELFAIKFDQKAHAAFSKALSVVRHELEESIRPEGLREPIGGAWHLYHACNGHLTKAGETHNFTEINDWTEDFDTPEDFDTWMKNYLKEPIVYEKGKARVMIAVPNLSSMHPLLAETLLRWHLTPTEGVESVALYMPRGIQPHDAARNNCVWNFLNSEATHLFFIDSDVIPPADALEKLIATDVDVVSGAYGTMKKSPETGEVVRIEVLFRLKELPDGTIESTPVYGDGVHEIDYAGGGCLMIRRNVIENMHIPWFEWQLDGSGKALYGEDVDFCRKLKKAGFKLYANFDVACKHSKEILI